MSSGLLAYLDSIRARDPAPHSRAEIMLYPGVWALGFHRIANALYRADLFFIARAVNHLSRFLTAIDRFGAEPFKLAYVVRAVSPGVFHHPAASVEDMYRPDFTAHTDSGRITIAE